MNQTKFVELFLCFLIQVKKKKLSDNWRSMTHAEYLVQFGNCKILWEPFKELLCLWDVYWKV